MARARERKNERVGNDEQGMCVVRAPLFLLAREWASCQVVRWGGVRVELCDSGGGAS